MGARRAGNLIKDSRSLRPKDEPLHFKVSDVGARAPLLSFERLKLETEGAGGGMGSTPNTGVTSILSAPHCGA